MIDKSRSAALFAQSKDVIEKQVPTEAPAWITDRYSELTRNCTPGGAAKDQVGTSGTSGT